MPNISIDTVFNIKLDFELAPFHKRLAAYMIDFAIMIAYLSLMKNFLYDWLNIGFKQSIGIDILIISLPMLLYSLISESNFNGQTLGKKIMSIRVISLDGGEPTLGQYITRWITKLFEWPFFFGYIAYFGSGLIGYIVITCMLGIAVVICISVTKNSQRLGDLAAGTVVVDYKTNLGVQDTIFEYVNTEKYVVTFPEVMKLSDNDINTIKTVLDQTRKSGNYDIAFRVEYKVKEVLNLNSNLHTTDFLQKLLEDYNYLATLEN